MNPDKIIILYSYILRQKRFIKISKIDEERKNCRRENKKEHNILLFFVNRLCRFSLCENRR